MMGGKRDGTVAVDGSVLVSEGAGRQPDLLDQGQLRCTSSVERVYVPVHWTGGDPRLGQYAPAGAWGHSACAGPMTVSGPRSCLS